MEDRVGVAAKDRGRGWAPGVIRPLMLALLLVASYAAVPAPAAAARFGDEEPWLRLRPILGEERSVLVEPGQTLHDVAFAERQGFEALRRLNPAVDPWVPRPGTVVRLPTRVILPEAEPKGIVINVPEMRLYDFTKVGPPRVLAVAVGDADDPTPTGRFSIGEKRVDPVWRVPKSILAERPGHPERVPPGKDNPLGSRWMTLGTSSYGIHGTNVRWSIGREATHGCVRVYEDEMQALFDRVPSGTQVVLIYAPFKWGTNGKDLFLEAHPDVYEKIPDHLDAALALPRELGLLGGVDPDRVWEVVNQAAGVPVRVGALP
jgi:L,D-transpeptidase ErfK/SrfK